MSAIGSRVGNVIGAGVLVALALAWALAPARVRDPRGAAAFLLPVAVVAEAAIIAMLAGVVRHLRLRVEAHAAAEAEAREAAEEARTNSRRDVDARHRTECIVQFLNEASDALAGSVDSDATLAEVARLAVPRIADWVAVDLASADGALRSVALVHSDPGHVAAAFQIRRARPPAMDDQAGIGKVVRTGVAELHERLSGPRLPGAFRDPETAARYASLGLLSSMSVPLRVQGLSVGAITLATAESGRRFGPDDLSFAQVLAHRASVALENARTFRESEEANRVKDEFLATISHELRTPLNAILGWTTMLRRKPDVDAKKALDIIERNARAQMRLIEDVLDVSRAVTGKLKIEPTEIDLAEVARAAVEVVTPMAEARAIALEVAIEVSPCPFFGDADRLQQAFWNVLSNALKFTGKGGAVRVRLERSGSHVELVVADNGRGIAPEFLPYVFDRFRQADSSTTRAAGGLGLGLAIVRHVVDLHGGTVRAESLGEGRGTTVTVTLPVRAVQSAAAFALPRGSVRASSGIRLSGNVDPSLGLAGVRVLVCDDDADARELLGAVLAAEGASVQAVATGARVLEAMREFGPHVLISDVGMPHVDGYDLIRRIRSLPEEAGGQTPAIALTAYARREDELKALVAGYQVHVAKPVEPARLVQVVANLVGRPMQRDKERPGN
jgi:signal transduction histidine kinase/ActR/RegA family two-component response regulator